MPDEDRGADDQRRDSAARLAEERQVLGQEAPSTAAPAPRFATDQTTIAEHGDCDERGEQSRAISTSRLTIRRRRARPPRLAASMVGIAASHQSPPVRDDSNATHDQLGEQVRRRARSRAGSRRGRRATRSACFETAPWYWPAIRLASVSPVLKSDHWIVQPGADHLRDGDRLADRAAEAEDDRSRDPRAGRREDDAPHHLPAGRAERERAFLELVRHARGTARGRCWRRSGRP